MAERNDNDGLWIWFDGFFKRNILTKLSRLQSVEHYDFFCHFNFTWNQIRFIFFPSKICCFCNFRGSEFFLNFGKFQPFYCSFWLKSGFRTSKTKNDIFDGLNHHHTLHYCHLLSFDISITFDFAFLSVSGFDLWKAADILT